LKVWTVSELDNVVRALQALVGTRLQEVQTTDNDVVLGFYSAQGMLWLWLDLNATRPSLLPWTELPLRLKSRKSPLHLFLRAHFTGRVLRKLTRDEESGRVVRLSFDGPELEIRLFPHGRNIIAVADDKRVAWQRPKEISTQEAPPPSIGKIPQRSLDELREQWLEARNAKGGKRQSTDVRGRLQADLERKEKAYAKVLEELRRKQDQPWKDVGDWLKTHQSLDVPAQWEPFVDKRRKLSWNIEQCYAKARDLEGKLFGTEQRLEILRNEMTRVRELLAKPTAELPLEPEKPPPRPLKDLGAEGRTLRLSDELMVVAGKSAADNMKLLRKARAWDLWLHLRDYPSSHAIVFRNKTANVNDAILQQIAAWFVRQHLGNKWARHSGERFHILLAECRHVRPIKGDKLGRVTYSDERVFIYRVAT
jgi:predicted ribosome quality control (RQC) complex YloA/Tae2 family protein